MLDRVYGIYRRERGAGGGGGEGWKDGLTKGRERKTEREKDRGRDREIVTVRLSFSESLSSVTFKGTALQ